MIATTSLNDLRDVAQAVAPSWWPLAPGLVFLLSLLSCLALWGLLQRSLRYRARAYRRAGIQLLASAQTQREVSVILKRVAIVSYGREKVASLYGLDWVEFLNAGCRGVQLDELADAHHQAVGNQLRQQAATWMKGHRR